MRFSHEDDCQSVLTAGSEWGDVWPKLSMWVWDFDEHMTLVPHSNEMHSLEIFLEAVLIHELKQYLGWKQHLSTAWMANFYVADLRQDTVETEGPRIEVLDDDEESLLESV